jgi:hypothetical protein
MFFFKSLESIGEEDTVVTLIFDPTIVTEIIRGDSYFLGPYLDYTAAPLVFTDVITTDRRQVIYHAVDFLNFFLLLVGFSTHFLSTNFWGKNVFFPKICAQKVAKLCSKKKTNSEKNKKVRSFFSKLLNKKRSKKFIFFHHMF